MVRPRAPDLARPRQRHADGPRCRARFRRSAPWARSLFACHPTKSIAPKGRSYRDMALFTRCGAGTGTTTPSASASAAADRRCGNRTCTPPPASRTASAAARSPSANTMPTNRRLPRPPLRSVPNANGIAARHSASTLIGIEPAAPVVLLELAGIQAVALAVLDAAAQVRSPTCSAAADGARRRQRGGIELRIPVLLQHLLAASPMRAFEVGARDVAQHPAAGAVFGDRGVGDATPGGRRRRIRTGARRAVPASGRRRCSRSWPLCALRKVSPSRAHSPEYCATIMSLELRRRLERVGARCATAPSVSPLSTISAGQQRQRRGDRQAEAAARQPDCAQRGQLRTGGELAQPHQRADHGRGREHGVGASRHAVGDVGDRIDETVTALADVADLARPAPASRRGRPAPPRSAAPCRSTTRPT